MDNEFKLERISLILLMNCNLKCKGCCVQAPYYKKKYNPSLDFIKLEIDCLFQIVDRINFFSVEGGEALLRKDFGKILGHLLQYKEKIGVEIPVVTNGTIIPDQDTVEAARALGDKIQFIIDDYGPLSTQVDKIVSLLSSNNIRHMVRNYNDNCYCGGWVDLYGNYEKKWDKAGAEDLHSRCAWVQKLNGVMEIIGGKIYFCPAARVFYERGLAVAQDEEIDFTANQSVEEIRQKLRNLFQKQSLAACQYCNGIHDKSTRFKPAVQLSDKELERAYLSPYLYREELH